MMKCSHCNTEVVLVPSASERARKYGETAAFYTKLFPIHSQCQLDIRAEVTRKLMATINS